MACNWNLTGVGFALAGRGPLLTSSESGLPGVSLLYGNEAEGFTESWSTRRNETQGMSRTIELGRMFTSRSPWEIFVRCIQFCQVKTYMANYSVQLKCSTCYIINKIDFTGIFNRISFKSGQVWWLMPLFSSQRQGNLWVRGQPGLQNKFQDSQSHIVRPCLEKTKNQHKTKKPN